MFTIVSGTVAAEVTERDIANAQREVSAIQQQLADLGSQLQERQKQLRILKEKQKQLDSSVKQAEIAQLEKRKTVQSLLGHLIRLSRMPPEAAIAMPGDIEQTLQAAQLLSTLTQQFRQQVEALSSQLKALESDKLALAETREKRQQDEAKLQALNLALLDKLKDRKRFEATLNRQYTAQRKRAEKAKRNAKTLAQLSRNLNQSLPRSSKKQARANTPLRTARSQNFLLPVSGTKLQSYGQKIGREETSQGNIIRGELGATVTSPIEGEVLFTGPFLDYGKIVIVKYREDYHLLLAGMQDIYCQTGQRLLAGEPVGSLSRKSPKAGELYLELRHHGKPIDPALWFG